MSNVWYTSDIHIGHKLVAGTRGFEDTEDHDKWLADVWDSQVRKDDMVFILGDISINGGQHALDWVEARVGRKVLISGNHDPVHPMDRTSMSKVKHWNKYFEVITPFMRRKLSGHSFLLQHFPYPGNDRMEDSRYEQYRLPDMGLPLVHGHTHSDKVHEFGINQFHVGIDAWHRLVPQSTVQTWLEHL